MGGRGNHSGQQFKVSGLQSPGRSQGYTAKRSRCLKVMFLGGHAAGFGTQLGWREQEGKSGHSTGREQWLWGLTLGGGLRPNCLSSGLGWGLSTVAADPCMALVRQPRTKRGPDAQAVSKLRNT